MPQFLDNVLYNDFRGLYSLRLTDYLFEAGTEIFHNKILKLFNSLLMIAIGMFVNSRIS